MTADGVTRTLVWLMFFATSVYGHVALKHATNTSTSSYAEALRSVAMSPWGWSAVAAWGFSCVLWVMVISRTKLIVANSVSSLNYALICATAWVLLGERLNGTQGIGVLCILAGIALVKG